MNQTPILISHSNKQNVWASLECHMSIIQIDHRPVQSNHAIIQLIDWNSKEISFRTPLRLSEQRLMILAVEVTYGSLFLSAAGLLVGRTQVDDQFEYRMEHQLSDRDRANVLHAMNQDAERSHWQWSEAIQSYRQLDIYHYISPQLDFQT
ncbi:MULTISPECIES: hypothetical protein [unclassified Paenibacillus]|uniref:hypothetical protein n=1 Tax=unclassified Paenibacillus TaxID=185978 RepID=UPI001AE7DA84|nr:MULTISPECIES: hypothetical protein [unclassified Paenibacillus]MBP1154385.1 hypothetical protein [Paenibacillus sp. PvP091]MBP1170231.1 hypothetical protein [Paenibacillus sp. PvR098]MBP2441259.1 hypothetical protein [Paenibacillus sp. PvP052]